MQISRKTILSSAFLALAVTGSALALVAPPEPPAPGGGGGGGGERKRPKFEDLDKNNDGYVTLDEMRDWIRFTQVSGHIRSRTQNLSLKQRQ